jgi:hypothetical protein
VGALDGLTRLQLIKTTTSGGSLETRDRGVSLIRTVVWERSHPVERAMDFGLADYAIEDAILAEL